MAPRSEVVMVFDEARRPSRLPLLPRRTAACRILGLSGLSLIPAFQGAGDFDTGLFSGLASDLLLRMVLAQFSVSPSRSANSDAVITSVLRILPSRRTSVSAVTR